MLKITLGLSILHAVTASTSIKFHNELRAGQNSTECQKELIDMELKEFDYEVRNKTCCGKSNGSLHWVERDTAVYVGCLPVKNIPKGFTIQIEDHNDNNFELIPVPCDTSSFQPSARASTDINDSGQCSRSKTVMYHNSMQMLCKGDTNKDNQFAYAQGYQPILLQYLTATEWLTKKMSFISRAMLMLLSISVLSAGEASAHLCPYFPNISLECLTFLKSEERCPAESYKHWNKICCGHIPGSVLQCEKRTCSINDFLQVAVAACVPDQDIQPGFSRKLVSNATGHIVINQDRCDDKHFEPAIRKAHTLSYPYCLEVKTLCTGKGEYTHCQGDNTRDNQCGCTEDYESECGTSFTLNDHCPCVEKKCPSGSHRNISYDRKLTCPEDIRSRIPLNHICVNDQLTSTAEMITTTTTTAPPSENVTTPGGQLHENSTDSGAKQLEVQGLSAGYIVLLVIVSIIIILVIIICCACYRKETMPCCRRRPAYKPTTTDEA